MSDVMGCLAVALALLGNVLVIRQKRAGFLCWMVSNSALILYNVQLGAWPQVALFGAYLALAVWGFLSWKRKPA